MTAPSPDSRRLKRAFGVMRAMPRRRLALQRAQAQGHPTRRSHHWLTTASGYRISVTVHEPADDQPRPGLVLVPGRGKPGSVFATLRYLLHAEETAVRGIRTVRFDPVGRGKSWGHDDFCGIEGQDSLRAVLDFVQSRRNVKAGAVGVASFSMGLSLAAPVLAARNRPAAVRFLLDWEGPADRSAILGGGPLPPTAQTALARDEATFWARREPGPYVARLPCAYHRLQGKIDHASGTDGVGGALTLIAAATRGTTPSTRLNDNPPDTAWRSDQLGSLRWAPSEPGDLNRTLVRSLVGALMEAG